jgi:hypothetical protein
MVRSRDSLVGIATGYNLDDRGVGVWIPVRGNIFLFSTSRRVVQIGSPPPPASIQWVPGALPPGLKLPGHESDHSPPTSAEVKKTWIYTSTPLYAFVA